MANLYWRFAHRLIKAASRWVNKVKFKAEFSKCRKIGDNISVGEGFITHGLENVSIGDNFHAGERLKLRTFSNWGGHLLHPSIIIGSNVNIESDCHIGAINRIEIGDNVLIASFVFISDHSHGTTDKEDISIAPLKRPLYSKGAIIIEHDVWIGEKVTILPNVTIGHNAIIGANSVVTKDIPPFAIACGNPARIIKQLQ